MNTIERHLQLCLNKIQKWADENGFKFSQAKTVSMHFCNLRKLHHEPTLTLNWLSHSSSSRTQISWGYI